MDAAHAAKDAWGEASAIERAEVLNAVADVIVANKEMLSRRGELGQRKTGSARPWLTSRLAADG